MDEDDGMQVKEAMTTAIRTIDADHSVEQAAIAMADQDVGALPVLSEERLLGMLTDRDIVLRVVVNRRSPATTLVRDVMSRTLRYCFEDEECGQVAESMARLSVLRMPVLNREHGLVGIITGGDLQVRASESAANNVGDRSDLVDEAVEETFPASDPIAPADDR